MTAILKATLVHRVAEFLREASVLVFVFSLLDQFLRGRLSLGWVLGTLAVSIYFFSGAIIVEVVGQRHLGGQPGG